jgi:hypothetical protein
MCTSLKAGAATLEINPATSQFLFGYPHVPRFSVGVHDPLLTSAFYVSDGTTAAVFVANDVAVLSKEIVERIRQGISELTKVPACNIMVTASHTHSAPITMRCISASMDPVVPPPDEDYVDFLVGRAVQAARKAYEDARPAELGLAIANAEGIGANRHDPAGPSDLRMPVLWVREAQAGQTIALMLVCCMHPTVLHEDSKLVSADFPGMARQYLNKNVLGGSCPIIYHTGPSGNQSPRHVVRSNTFEEADRLGCILGKSVEEALARVTFIDAGMVVCASTQIELPLRPVSSLEKAEQRLRQAHERLSRLRDSGAPRAQVRTAECDCFGAEENVELVRASIDGRLKAAASTCMPAEIQLIRIGPWEFVGWPGEVFVEFGLRIKQRFPNAHVISLANGDLQGYLVTAEAVSKGGYESLNALFKSPDSGDRIVEATDSLLTSVDMASITA